MSLLIRRLETHARLSPEDREAILDLPHQVKTFATSAYLVREGEPPRTCVVLIDGYAVRQKLAGSGGRKILSINIPGEALDFQSLFLDCADHNVQALTAVEVAIVSRQPMLELVRARLGVAHAVLANLAVEGSIFREWMLNVGRRDARTRLAHLLCEFATRLRAQGLAPEGRFHLPMTQEQLGDALGLTSVHVNRSLKALEADGLLQREGRSIAFPDVEALRLAGDFSDLYLHLSREIA